MAQALKYVVQHWCDGSGGERLILRLSCALSEDNKIIFGTRIREENRDDVICACWQSDLRVRITLRKKNCRDSRMYVPQLADELIAQLVQQKQQAKTGIVASQLVLGGHILCYNPDTNQQNMSLHETIRESLKEAMKARDAARLRTVRSILTAFTNELVATGKTPQDIITDDVGLSVIKRLAKQRKDSISQYEAASRNDLAEPEKEELVVLESYLPTLMSQEQIKPIAEAKKAELGVTDKSKLGVLVGAVMKELAGKADGTDVKVVVESLFN